jgi:hypothetical protein
VGSDVLHPSSCQIVIYVKKVLQDRAEKRESEIPSLNSNAIAKKVSATPYSGKWQWVFVTSKRKSSRLSMSLFAEKGFLLNRVDILKTS